MGYGIGRVPADVDSVSETIAKLDAEKMTARAHRPEREGRRFLRCPRCGQTGYTGDYPFSTCPPNCDDCN